MKNKNTLKYQSKKNNSYASICILLIFFVILTLSINCEYFDNPNDTTPLTISTSSSTNMSNSSTNMSNSSTNTQFLDTTLPTINNQIFTIAENVAIGTRIGTINAMDNVGVVAYTITDGNIDDAFAIENNGILSTLANLDYEVIDQYTLAVEVEDAKSNANSAIITVNITDINFTLTSSQTDGGFTPGGNLPLEFKANLGSQCTGNNNFPKLKWEEAPINTRSFVLIVDDPDGGNWVHLNLYNISATANEIPKILGNNNSITSFGNLGGTSPSLGINGWSANSYIGPCPPSGTHTYIFKLYAMNVNSLSSINNLTRSQFESANASKIIDSKQIQVDSAR